MRILVTGGAGFLGSALARRLHTDGHTVVALDNFSRGKDHRVPPEISRYRGDIRDHAIVRSAARQADVIWHLAYKQGTQTFYSEPREVIDVALTGMMNILHACQELVDAGESPREVLLVSSSETYQVPPPGYFPTAETVPLSVPDPLNPRYSYGAGKIASEVALNAYAAAGTLKRAVIVRPHNVYGPDMGHEHVIPQFADRMLKLYGDRFGVQEFPIQGTGAETRCFNYIDDAVDGLLTVQEHGVSGEIYHLGDPREEISMSDLAHRIAEICWRTIRVIPGALPKGSPPRRKPDVGKLQALGYRPRTNLDSGLRRTIGWYIDEALQQAERRSE